VVDSDRVNPASRFICSLVIGPYARLIRTYARGVLLDCGCGQAPYYGIYRSHVTEVVCIDWEQSEHTSRHVDQFVDLNGPLPLASESFDTVLLMDVLEHIAEPGGLVAELARLLRPGGVLLAGVPFFYWLHEEPHDYFRYTEFALRRMAADAGLHVLQLEPYGGYPDVVLDLLNKAAARSELTTRIFLAGAQLMAGTRPYRRLRQRTGRTFPLGYCFAGEKTSS
jgi:SAM-dependent methyltransferase